MKKILIAIVILLLSAGGAEAKIWKIDYKDSKLSFSGTQTKQPFSGVFSSFQASVDFDPAAPEKAKIDVTIDMASAKTGDLQRDQALPGSDWFDVKKFPQATFHITQVTKTDDTHFSAKAALTIKGVKKDVELPFVLTADTLGTHAKGSLTVDRTDYTVGMGDWATDAYVARPVTISFDLVAE